MKNLTYFFRLLLILFVVFLTACSSTTMSVQTWGEKGLEQGQFNEPFDLAVDANGFVYVTDVRNKRVQKFTSDGDFILAFGQKLFEKPSGIGIGLNNTVWVTDYDLDRVFHFDSKGQLITAWGSAGDKLSELSSPVDIAVNSNGLIYVVDQYHHRIQVFSPSGHFLRTWGKQGKVNVIRSALNFIIPDAHDSEFYYPSRITIGSDNHVYVSDAYNNRVQVFDTGGRFLRSIGGMGLWGGRFRVSSGIAIDTDNTLFVADFYNNRIQQFDHHGNFIQSWGKEGTKLGSFSGPTGVAVGRDGQIYVTDWGNHRIQKFYK